jgi:alcohol dehydrogenase (cytochrome c)
VWQSTVADYKQGYSFTSAPLAIDGAIVIGNSGGDMATRGFIVALDAATGKERWRFETIPRPGESGAESWAGNSWKQGGAAPWMTGSYDVDLQRIYWAVGNPAPDHFGSARRGDNLYSTASSRSIRWAANFCGTSNSHRTTCTTGTRLRCR